MKSRSFRVALGGVLGALSIVMLFFSGLFPFASIALPAVAGVLFMPIVVESGRRWAFFCYLGVAVLAALLVPDKEVVCLFVFYLGYYPILKSKIEELSHRWLQWGCKLLLFNGAILLAYYLMLHVFGLAAVADEFSTYTTGFLVVLLAVANVTNVVYDIALTRVVSMYVHWFRPKFLRRF